MKIGLLYLLLVLLTIGVHRPTSAQAHQIMEPTPPSIVLEAMTAGPDLTATQVFSQVSPSIAFIETPSGIGSGVLIEGDYLLTNAHVVYPYEQVRVVFSDGSEFLDVPVYAWDLLVDLALVGPIEAPVVPLVLFDGSDLEIGDELYLVGYPTEVELFPQPTITQGILSRIRQWPAVDLSLFQTDATIAGGQSGGVLTTHQGEVIGISTFTLEGFGLAISVGDALPRLDAMLAQDVELSLGDRRIDFADSSTTHESVLRDDFDEQTYLLTAPAGTEVDVRVDGTAIPYFSVVDDLGYAVVDSHFKGETGAVATFTVFSDGPYFVRVSQVLDYEAPFSLTASYPLVAFEDPDDGTMLTRGQSLIGSLDTPLDYDYYDVYLNANELVEIVADSLGTHSVLMLHYMGLDRDEFLTDDFSGGGVFGSNDKIVYRAPASGIHRLGVAHSGDQVATGGYILSIGSAERTAEPTIVQASKQLVDMPAGLMALYESEDYALELLYPFDRTSAFEEVCDSEAETFCISGFYVNLAVTENDLAFVPDRDRELSRYVDYLLVNHEFNAPGFELISREPITTIQGLRGESFAFFTDTGLSIGSGVAFVDEANNVVFDALYFVDSEEEYEVMEPLFAESFASYRSWGDGEREDDPIHFLDQGIRHMTGRNIFAARSAFTKAIELDPELIPAYVRRAHVHRAFGQTDKLVDDMDRAILLAPDDPTLHREKAELLYQSRQYQDARDAVDEAIWRDRYDSDSYILSAKIAAMQGETDLAFSDLDDALLLSGGFISFEAWETLGFLYLLTDDFENAAFEFDDLYDSEWYTPQVMLGRGIAYAKLGDDEIARPLLDEGIKAAVAEGVTNDPQLEALYDMAKDAEQGLAE